ncbi:hypothetical protein MP228_001745 [Amoeboaphelidium protococcarum]|nr:hypothetical protein MP228_001745 [Amoeboaphelidium protococcarum]
MLCQQFLNLILVSLILNCALSYSRSEVVEDQPSCSRLFYTTSMTVSQDTGHIRFDNVQQAAFSYATTQQSTPAFIQSHPRMVAVIQHVPQSRSTSAVRRFGLDALFYPLDLSATFTSQMSAVDHAGSTETIVFNHGDVIEFQDVIRFGITRQMATVRVPFKIAFKVRAGDTAHGLLNLPPIKSGFFAIFIIINIDSFVAGEHLTLSVQNVCGTTQFGDTFVVDPYPRVDVQLNEFKRHHLIVDFLTHGNIYGLLLHQNDDSTFTYRPPSLVYGMQKYVTQTSDPFIELPYHGFSPFDIQPKPYYYVDPFERLPADTILEQPLDAEDRIGLPEQSEFSVKPSQHIPIKLIVHSFRKLSGTLINRNGIEIRIVETSYPDIETQLLRLPDRRADLLFNSQIETSLLNDNTHILGRREYEGIKQSVYPPHNAKVKVTDLQVVRTSDGAVEKFTVAVHYVHIEHQYQSGLRLNPFTFVNHGKLYTVVMWLSFVERSYHLVGEYQFKVKNFIDTKRSRWFYTDSFHILDAVNYMMVNSVTKELENGKTVQSADYEPSYEVDGSVYYYDESGIYYDQPDLPPINYHVPHGQQLPPFPQKLQFNLPSETLERQQSRALLQSHPIEVAHVDMSSDALSSDSEDDGASVTN